MSRWHSLLICLADALAVSCLASFIYLAVLADQQVELLIQQPNLLRRGTTPPQLLQSLLYLLLLDSGLPNGIVLD